MKLNFKDYTPDEVVKVVLGLCIVGLVAQHFEAAAERARHKAELSAKDQDIRLMNEKHANFVEVTSLKIGSLQGQLEALQAYQLKQTEKK